MPVNGHRPRSAPRANSIRRSESGNALILVLLAVACLAALSWVVSQSGKTNAISDKDEQMAAFARLTQFPPAVQTVVGKMLQSGTDIADLDFGRDAKGKGAVFEHMTYQNPPLAIGAGSDWGFATVNKKGEGWFISGIGTDTAGGKDVFAYLDGLTQEGCEQAKKALGLATTPLAESTTVNLAVPGAADAVAGDNAWSFNVHNMGTPPDPQMASCVRNGNRKDGEPNYIYYHVIVAK